MTSCRPVSPTARRALSPLRSRPCLDRGLELAWKTLQGRDVRGWSTSGLPLCGLRSRDRLGSRDHRHHPSRSSPGHRDRQCPPASRGPCVSKVHHPRLPARGSWAAPSCALWKPRRRHRRAGGSPSGVLVVSEGGHGGHAGRKSCPGRSGSGADCAQPGRFSDRGPTAPEPTDGRSPLSLCPEVLLY
jgi:hypothetical protein